MTKEKAILEYVIRWLDSNIDEQPPEGIQEDSANLKEKISLALDPETTVEEIQNSNIQIFLRCNGARIQRALNLPKIKTKNYKAQAGTGDRQQAGTEFFFSGWDPPTSVSWSKAQGTRGGTRPHVFGATKMSHCDTMSH